MKRAGALRGAPWGSTDFVAEYEDSRRAGTALLQLKIIMAVGSGWVGRTLFE